MSRGPSLLKRRLIRNRRTEIAVGFAAFGLGALLLHDAYDNRGIDAPRAARPFFFW